MSVILESCSPELLLENEERFKNGFLELVITELEGHTVGLKSKSPLTGFVIIIQPIFTGGLC